MHYHDSYSKDPPQQEHLALPPPSPGPPSSPPPRLNLTIAHHRSLSMTITAAPVHYPQPPPSLQEHHSLFASLRPPAHSASSRQLLALELWTLRQVCRSWCSMQYGGPFSATGSAKRKQYDITQRLVQFPLLVCTYMCTESLPSVFSSYMCVAMLLLCVHACRLALCHVQPIFCHILTWMPLPLHLLKSTAWQCACLACMRAGLPCAMYSPPFAKISPERHYLCTH